MTRARDLGDFIADGAAAELVVDTTTLVVDSTNNRVGIGTASPSQALDVVGNATITTADNTTQLTLVSTDADANSGPSLIFSRDSGSPADNDAGGKISFQFDDDAGNPTRTAAIFTTLVDASNGSEDGKIHIETMIGGAEAERFGIGPTEVVINEASVDLDFRVESDSDTHALFVEGSSGNVGIGTSSPNAVADLHVADTTDARIWVEATSSDTLELYAGTGVGVFNRSNSHLVLGTNNAERFRIGSSGQLGIGGATYGTSGQVLTSGGSGAAPSWSTVSGGATSVNGLSDGYADSTNIGLGDVAFDSLSSGTNNVFLGITTGGSLDSGQSNVGVGKGALENLSTGQGNVALNFEALNSVTTSSQNIGIGRYSGRYTTGNSNIAIGEQALEGSSGSTNGNNNVCIGLQAAHSATSLYESVILGYQAGYLTTTSERPVAVGYQALYYSTGDKNVAIGVEAGKGSSSGFTGKRNIFIGDEGGASMTSGADCIFMGRQSGYDNTTGSYNICLGIGSGGDITTGSNNIFLGYNAGLGSLQTGSNNICLGYNSDTIGSASSNSVTLGNSSITHLRCQEQSIQGLSDARDKEDIADLYAGLDFVDRLKPVSFTWNMRDGGKVGQKDIGFIAQDLQQVQKDTEIEIPGLVDDVNPEKLEAAYGKLLPIMVTAIQELSEKVKKLEAQLNT